MSGHEGFGPTLNMEERDPKPGEQTHTLSTLHNAEGPAESNAESNNHCSQDRKADGRNKIEVGTCVHLHQTRVEVIKPNNKQQETTQLLARQPITENQTLPELLAKFSTALEVLAPHLTVVKVREVTSPPALTITQYDPHQHKIRTCSGKGKSAKRKHTGERPTRSTKRAQPRQNNQPTSGDRDEEEECRRRINDQKSRWEEREEGDNSCAH